MVETMTGRGRFLVGGIVTILLASAILFYCFSIYETGFSTPTDHPDGGDAGVGGLPEQDENYAAADDRTDELTVGDSQIPWETGLLAFVIISSVTMSILFARLREDDVLDGLRKDIYAYISENPGEHLAEITRQFNISSSSARHHLDVLEWSDKIVSHKSGKQKHFYPNMNGYRRYTSGFEYKEIMATLKNDTTRDMVKFLIKHEGSNQKMIAQALNIHPSTVNWHAKRLKSACILVKTKDGKDIHYILNKELDLVKVISLIEGASS